MRTATIKTNLELLVKNRDDAQSMGLALQAQINIIQRKLLSMIKVDKDTEKLRQSREAAMAALKTEKLGHDEIIAEFDKMISEEKP